MSDAFKTVKPPASRLSGGRLMAAEAWLGRVTGFGVKKRASLYKRMSKFTRRGVSVPQAIEGMWQRSTARNDAVRHCYGDILRLLMDGKSVANSMERYLPPTERVLIAAGERTGQLGSGFEMAAAVADGAKRMRGEVTNKLFEPAILVFALIAVMIVITVYVTPPLLEISPDPHTWPMAPKVLYYVSEFVRGWGIITAVLLVILGVVVTRSIPRWTGPTRVRFDKYIPPYTLYRAYQNASFLLALGELTRTGTPVTEAIGLMERVASPWMRWHLNRMIVRMHEGFAPGNAIDTGMLDQDTMDDVSDYMKAGSFSDAITSIGEDAVEDGVAKVGRTAGWIFGISLALVGFMMVMMSIGPMQFVGQKFDQMQGGASHNMK